MVLQHFELIMAWNVLNAKLCSPLDLSVGLIGNYHGICHYSSN